MPLFVELELSGRLQEVSGTSLQKSNFPQNMYL